MQLEAQPSHVHGFAAAKTHQLLISRDLGNVIAFMFPATLERSMYLRYLRPNRIARVKANRIGLMWNFRKEEIGVAFPCKP
jgi:hypothetical protein